MSDTPILYYKPTCPWCQDAIEFFNNNDIRPTLLDVTDSIENRQALLELTGQSKVPSFKYKDFVVYDFDTKEFMNAVRKNPSIKKELGL